MARLKNSDIMSALAALAQHIPGAAPVANATAVQAASSAPKAPRPKTVEVRTISPTKPEQTWQPFKSIVIHNGAVGRAYRETRLDRLSAMAALTFLGIPAATADQLLTAKGL